MRTGSVPMPPWTCPGSPASRFPSAVSNARVCFPQPFLSGQKFPNQSLPVIIRQQAPLQVVTSHKSLCVTCPILMTREQDWTEVPSPPCYSFLFPSSLQQQIKQLQFLICRSPTFPVQCSAAKRFAFQAWRPPVTQEKPGCLLPLCKNQTGREER